MKFLKHNILTLVVIVLLIISIVMIRDLQVKYNDLSSSYFMLQSRINNISNNANSYVQSNKPREEAKEVMTPSELAKYLGIEMSRVYDIVTKDNTMPYVQVNGEYRFNKAAIDKWMDGRTSIEIR